MSHTFTFFWITEGDFSIVTHFSSVDPARNSYHTNKSDSIVLINSYEPYMVLSSTYNAIRFTLYLDRYKQTLSSQFPNKFSLLAENSDEGIFKLKQLFAQYESCLRTKTVAAAILAESLSLQIILNLLGNFAVSAKENNSIGHNTTVTRVQEICKYIDINYATNFSLDEIAEYFYITPQYISKLFRTTMHISLFHYVTQVRLSHAIYDLQTTTLTIENIAEKNGFANVRSFSTAFYKIWNVHPSTFRKKSKFYLSIYLNRENFGKRIILERYM